MLDCYINAYFVRDKDGQDRNLIRWRKHYLKNNYYYNQKMIRWRYILPRSDNAKAIR